MSTWTAAELGKKQKAKLRKKWARLVKKWLNSDKKRLSSENIFCVDIHVDTDLEIDVNVA